MKQYLLSVYQPDGPAPDQSVLEPIMKNLATWNDELREAGSWVFSAGLHPPESATVLRASGAAGASRAASTSGTTGASGAASVSGTAGTSRVAGASRAADVSHAAGAAGASGAVDVSRTAGAAGAVDVSGTAGASGDEVLVTDGPFTEGKEHLGGFTIIQAEDLDEALGWARKLALIVAPLSIEVRPFA